MPIGSYLASAKNAVGAVLGAAAFAAVGPFGMGMDPVSWSAATAGAYGLGALLTPRRTRQEQHAATADQLRVELQQLVDTTDRDRARLPQDAYASFHTVVTTLRSILDRAQSLGGSPEHLHVVTATIRDYLPTSLTAYASVAGTNARTSDGRDPGTELRDQLDLLADRLARVHDSVVAGDAAALEDQGRFLRDKFHRSSLDLGKPR